MSKERRLCGHRRAERSYSTIKVRRGDLVQGKEQQLCFAGESMKRYPTSKVRDTPRPNKRNASRMVGVARGHQRTDTLKPYHRKLASLIKQATALSNSKKLSHAMWGHPRLAGHGGEI